MSRLRIALISLASFLLATRAAHAEPLAPHDAPAGVEASANHGDGLFPGAGHVVVGASTGVPFVGIGEVGYAFSDHVTLGAIGGITPTVTGAGLRPRVAIGGSGPLRVTIVMPVLYYPKTHISGGEPWFLINPVVSLETRIGSGARLHAGTGLVAAACADSVFGREHDERFMGGVWNTFQIGGGLRVAENTEAFADAQVILRGAKLAGSEWIGGPPFVASVGITRRF
jgi:hypothetical protein